MVAVSVMTYIYVDDITNKNGRLKGTVFNYMPVVPDDEFGEKSVSVLLDGEESELIFIDHPSTEMSVSKRKTTAFF